MGIAKYIVHAQEESDLFALLTNTRKHVFNVHKWSDSDIFRSEDDSSIGEDEILTALDWNELEYVDDHLFGQDVPVGGMVVLYDGKTVPHNGFVCGNGNDWIVVQVPRNVRERILKDHVENT